MVATSSLYGDELAWPVLGQFQGLGAAAFPLEMQANRFEGFAGDGDYVEISISAATFIQYFNAAGSSQWTVTLTNIDVNCDDWVGVTFDGSLIYAIAVDEGTTPNTYHLVSVNSSGTITQLGNGVQPTSDFSTTAGTWFNSSAPTTLGHTTMMRAARGSGNLLVFMTDNAGQGSFAEIDITDGSFVSDPAKIRATAGPDAPTFLTQNGVYWCADAAGFFLATAEDGFINTNVNTDPMYLIMGSPSLDDGNRRPIVWKDEIYMNFTTSNANFSHPRIFNRDDWETFIDSIAKMYGLL